MQQVNVVGTMIQIRGDGAQFIIDRHKQKLQKCPLDCGVDIFPKHIRVMADAQPSPEDPAYEIIGLNEARNLLYVHTGVHWITGPNTFTLLTERSSTIEKLNGGRVLQGIIDANYTGEIIIRVEAMTNELDDVISGIEMCIKEKLAMAQMIPLGFFYPGFQMVSESGIIVDSGRGGNGFGSTDQKN